MSYKAWIYVSTLTQNQENKKRGFETNNGSSMDCRETNGYNAVGDMFRHCFDTSGFIDVPLQYVILYM